MRRGWTEKWKVYNGLPYSSGRKTWIGSKMERGVKEITESEGAKGVDGEKAGRYVKEK